MHGGGAWSVHVAVNYGIRQKRSKCPRASRRLREARLFIGQLVSKFNATDNRVDLHFAEGVAWIATRVSFVSHKTALDITYKTSYLNNSPWRLAEADDPAQAKIFHKQLRLGDVSRMCPLELDFRDRLLPFLEALFFNTQFFYVQVAYRYKWHACPGSYKEV